MYYLRKKQNGFTLIEVMIVVVIIAIIAAVAIPSYNNSVLKSKRAIGKAELLKVVSRQEHYFINNKAYATTLAALGYPATFYIDDQGQSTALGSSIYQIALSGASASAFTVQAVPKNAQADDTQCATLQLSSTGVKSISGGTSTASECW